MMVHLHQGNVTWTEISRLHSEQRIVVPSLVALAFAALRHSWVIPRETTFSVSLLFATLAIWWIVIVRLVAPARREWTLALITLLACSLTQAENWTWGFQMSFFVANLCAAVMTLGFVMADRPWSLPLGVSALIVGSYSIGFGLTATASGMLFYALNRERWKFAGWAAVSIIILLFYRNDYQSTLYHPVNEPLTSRIADTTHFALIALGAPIARSAGIDWCGLIGFIAIAALTPCVLLPWRRGRISEGSLALVALASMPILGAFEVAYGRLFEGLQAALGGRFTTPTSLLWITLILVAARLRIRTRFIVPSVIPLALFWCWSQVGGYAEVRDHALSLFAAAQVIPRWNVATEDEFPPLWPAEAELQYLYSIRDGPFYHP